MKKLGFVLAGFTVVAALLLRIYRSEETVTLPAPEKEAEATVKPAAANDTLAWWNREIDAAVKDGQWELAADYSERKAAYYRSIGDTAQADRAALLSEQYWEQAIDKTKRLSATVAFAPEQATIIPYVSVPAAPNPKPAKFEPTSGVYLGMYAADKRAGFNNMPGIETVYGRKHAIYLNYTGWRKVQTDTNNSYFPLRFAERVKAVGGAMQIGWEPRYGLDDVKDDEYVRTFAKEAAATGVPIFLRYASEMNGNWVPWYGDPAKYVEKFRLIHDIMAQEAPNVAMVWSPNFSPNNNIDAYYPGDAYVDWVGFSLYASAISHDKEDYDNTIINNFKALYDKYPNKPIMISEGAVTHYDLKVNKSFDRWAEGQIGSMYELLPRMFPRIKAITYFNFSKASSIRNNKQDVYDIGENAFADSIYRRAISDPMYLSEVKNGASSPSGETFVPLASARQLEGKHDLFAYVSLPRGEQPYAVGVVQNGHSLGTAYEMPWKLSIDFSKLDRSAPIAITAYDRQMKAIAATNAFLAP